MPTNPHKTVAFPFGWEDGDPLIVCLNPLHREYVQRAFKLRAHYILPLDMVAGRRYNKVIVFNGLKTPQEQDRFKQWIDECLKTKLPIDGEFYLV